MVLLNVCKFWVNVIFVRKIINYNDNDYSIKKNGIFLFIVYICRWKKNVANKNSPLANIFIWGNVARISANKTFADEKKSC